MSDKILDLCHVVHALTKSEKYDKLNDLISRYNYTHEHLHGFINALRILVPVRDKLSEWNIVCNGVYNELKSRGLDAAAHLRGVLN